MGFASHDEHSNIGTDWIDHVPAGWRVVALKWLFKIVGGSTPKSEEPSLWDGGILWATPSDLSKLDSLYLRETRRTISVLGLESCGTTVVPAGSIILSTRAPIGSLALADAAMCTNQGCKSLIPFEYADSTFYTYLLSISSQQLNVRGKGTTFLELSADALGAFMVPVPPLPEQKTIATFLDTETSKIDALIAEQRRLIELLKEKRQAVISHAVTKGLNPDVKMKNSGVEWLGEVPEHWEVTKIKRIVSIPVTDGPHETPLFVDNGVPFVSAEAVSSGRIDFTRIRGYISKEDNEKYSEKYSPKLNDIYMVKSGATTGVTAIVEDREDFNIWSPLAVIRCGRCALPKFVLNFMRSRNFQEGISLNWSFGTQQNIGMGVIENLTCPLPPLEEQGILSFYIDEKVSGFDTLLEEAKHAISLLQERRTALISAAVTGKIDVRDYAKRQAA